MLLEDPIGGLVVADEDALGAPAFERLGGVCVAVAAVADERDDAALLTPGEHLGNQQERPPDVGASGAADAAAGALADHTHRRYRGGVRNLDQPVDDVRQEGRLDPLTPDSLDA